MSGCRELSVLREDSASQQEELLRTLALLQVRLAMCRAVRLCLAAMHAITLIHHSPCVLPCCSYGPLTAVPAPLLQASHKREEDLRRQVCTLLHLQAA